MNYHEHKLLECAAEFKADDGKPNTVEGYASVFGNVDNYGDVVLPGAFKKTIKERVAKGLVPLVADHNWSVDALLGTVIAAEEDSKGLHFTAKLSAVPSVQEVRTKMLEGHLKAMSFSFRTLGERFPETPEIVDGKTVMRYLTEVALLDISPVVIGANARAVITQVKAFNELIDGGRAAGLDADGLRIASVKLLAIADELERKIWEDAESEIRWRLKDPDLFKDDSFRSKDIEKGVRLIIGKLKNPPEGEDRSMVAQAVRFDKNEGWTMAKAKAWAADHPELNKSAAAAEPVRPLTTKALEAESLSMVTEMDMFNFKLGIQNEFGSKSALG